MYSAYPAGYAPYTKRWQPCSNLMNYKLKRHKLLKTLAPSSLEMHAKKLGVSFDDIYKILNISESDFHKIASRLYNEDEIKYTNVDHEGVYSTIKGLQSFTDKKYLNEFNQILTSNIKNAVQIIIPVLSLIVAVTVVTVSELVTPTGTPLTEIVSDDINVGLAFDPCTVGQLFSQASLPNCTQLPGVTPGALPAVLYQRVLSVVIATTA